MALRTRTANCFSGPFKWVHGESEQNLICTITSHSSNIIGSHTLIGIRSISQTAEDLRGYRKNTVMVKENH